MCFPSCRSSRGVGPEFLQNSSSEIQNFVLLFGRTLLYAGHFQNDDILTKDMIAIIFNFQPTVMTLF